MLKIKKSEPTTLNEKVERDISKTLNERAETNIKKIDWMELNEMLAALKEQIEYDINPDLEYWRVIVDVDNGKAYIDIETKEEDTPLDDIYWDVESVVSTNDFSGYDNADELKEFKEKILAEKSKIVTKIIPEIARKWGFRNIKESCNEAVDDDDDWDPDRIDVLWDHGRESIIKDIWGYGISDGWTVNRFFITEEGKPLFDYQPSKQARAAVDKLIKSGELVHEVHESCNEDFDMSKFNLEADYPLQSTILEELRSRVQQACHGFPVDLDDVNVQGNELVADVSIYDGNDKIDTWEFKFSANPKYDSKEELISHVDDVITDFVDNVVEKVDDWLGESLTEAKGKRGPREEALMMDMLEYNLFKEGQNNFPIVHDKTVKHFNEFGDIVTQKSYSIDDQAVFDYDGDHIIYYLSLIDPEDAELAQTIAEKLGLRFEMNPKHDRYKLKDGYNYLCAIYAPNVDLDKTAAQYIYDKNISPDIFRYSKDVASKLKTIQKRVDKAAAARAAQDDK